MKKSTIALSTVLITVLIIACTLFAHSLAPAYRSLVSTDLAGRPDARWAVISPGSYLSFLAVIKITEYMSQKLNWPLPAHTQSFYNTTKTDRIKAASQNYRNTVKPMPCLRRH